MTAFNTEFGRYRYTVMSFGATVAGVVFQHKLDEYFGHVPNVIVIADDIMVVGKQPNHKNTTKHSLLCLKQLDNTMLSSTVKNCSTSQLKLNFMERLTLWMGANQPKERYKPLLRCQYQAAGKRCNLLLGW